MDLRLEFVIIPEDVTRFLGAALLCSERLEIIGLDQKSIAAFTVLEYVIYPVHFIHGIDF